MNDTEEATTLCTTCKGRGEIPVGFISATYESPRETVEGECPICDGEGKVTLEVLAEYDGVLPNEDDAAETYNSRMTEREYEPEWDD